MSAGFGWADNHIQTKFLSLVTEHHVICLQAADSSRLNEPHMLFMLRNWLTILFSLPFQVLHPVDECTYMGTPHVPYA